MGDLLGRGERSILPLKWRMIQRSRGPERPLLERAGLFQKKDLKNRQECRGVGWQRAASVRKSKEKGQGKDIHGRSSRKNWALFDFKGPKMAVEKNP